MLQAHSPCITKCRPVDLTNRSFRSWELTETSVPHSALQIAHRIFPLVSPHNQPAPYNPPTVISIVHWCVRQARQIPWEKASVVLRCSAQSFRIRVVSGSVTIPSPPTDCGFLHKKTCPLQSRSKGFEQYSVIELTGLRENILCRSVMFYIGIFVDGLVLKQLRDVLRFRSRSTT